MANSTCMKCGNTRFEIEQNSPANSNYKLNFVQCSSCGAVAGVLDYYNIGKRLEEIEKKIDGLSSSNSGIAIINENVGRLFNYVKSKLDKV